MDIFAGKSRELGNVASNDVALCIEFARLCDGIEYSKVRLRITACGCGPLPTPIIGREVKVVQLPGEVLFAPAPVYTQVFGQEACNDHPESIMHIAGLVQLAHGSVHDGIACDAVAPGPKKLVSFGAAFP